MTEKIDFTAARKASLAFAAELDETEFSGLSDITGEKDVRVFGAGSAGLCAPCCREAADVRGIVRGFAPDSAECLKKDENGGVAAGREA